MRRSSIFLSGNTSTEVILLKENVLFLCISFVHVQHYFIMAYGNTSNRNQDSLPLHCNAPPAIFNLEDGPISSLPPRNESIMIQELHSLNLQELRNEHSTIRYSRSVTHHLPGRDSHPSTNHLSGNAPHTAKNSNSLRHQLFSNGDQKIQDFHPPTEHQLTNKSNLIQHSHLLNFQQPSNGIQRTGNFQPVTDQLSTNESNIPQHFYSRGLQLPTNRMQMTEKFHAVTDQISTNESNIPQHFCLHGFQPPTNRMQMTEKFHAVTDQLSTNEPNIPQHSYSPDLQLPSNGINMNQSSNMFIQQPSRSISSAHRVKYSPTQVQSQIEPRRNQFKYPLAHHQSSRESIMRQGLQSIFQSHSNDTLRIVQNQYMPGQQTIGNQESYPSSNFPEMGFNWNQDLLAEHHDLSLSNTSLHPNLYPKYSENLHICVIGPPGSGKANLIRTFARNDNILTTAGKQFRKVLQQGMVCFGVNLTIDIWHAEDLTLAANDLRSHCESSKTVLVLLYKVAQKTTLLTVLEWIKLLKSDIVTDTPIILVENNTDVESSFDSREFFSGVRVQEDYKLEAFYQCSTECVDDVERVFLSAAHKAFHRKIQSGNFSLPDSSDVF